MQIRALILCCAMVAPSLAMADDSPPPPPQGVWTGKGQIGYLASQGFSAAKSANARSIWHC